MTKYLSITVILSTCIVMAGLAQQKTFGSAIVKSKTSITFPDNNNNRGGGDNGDGDAGGRPSGMESKSTTYYRGDLIKTYNESDFGNNTVIIDKKTGRTTTLIQAMGRKTAYYSTEEERQAMEERMRKRMDSIRQARGESADNAPRQQRPQDMEVVETGETKKIAGFTCKKAIIKSKTRQGEINETIVWYCPDLKRPEGYPVNFGGGGGRGFAGAMAGRTGNNFSGLDKIDGFIMGIEVSRPNGFKMETEVTDLQVDPQIADKVFEIPKGYDIKPISEMEGQFGGRRGFRGSPPGGENN